MPRIDGYSAETRDGEVDFGGSAGLGDGHRIKAGSVLTGPHIPYARSVSLGACSRPDRVCWHVQSSTVTSICVNSSPMKE